MKDFDRYAAVPGTKFEDLMPDFFLDEFLEAEQKNIVDKQNSEAKVGVGPHPASSGSGPIQDVLNQLETIISDDVVKKTNAVFAFSIPDDNSEWYLDLKTGSGSCGLGKPIYGPADVTFYLKMADFQKMFAGKLKPMTAYMTGKLKISGNLGKAMALEKLMGKMQQARA